MGVSKLEGAVLVTTLRRLRDDAPQTAGRSGALVKARRALPALFRHKAVQALSLDTWHDRRVGAKDRQFVVLAGLQCVECGRYDVKTKGWKAMHGREHPEDEPAVFVFCPECWEASNQRSPRPP